MAVDQVLALCKFMEICFPITITRATTFDNLLASIKIKIDEYDPTIRHLSPNSVSFGYSVGNVNNYVSIADDEELRSIFTLVAEFKTTYVNMKIDVQIDYLSDDSSNDRSDNNISDDEYLTDDAPSDEGDTPNYLENYCKHPKKLLKSAHWANGIRHVGQLFDGVRQFRKELRKYSVEVGFEYDLKKNDLSRVTAYCAYKDEKGCEWYVHARHDKVRGYFVIRELVNTHSCGYLYRKLKNKRMSCHIVADEVRGQLNDTRLLSPKDVRAEIKLDYGIDISYTQSWRAVEVAKNEFYGNHVSTYDQLRCLIKNTIMANPESKMFVEFDPSNKHFQRLFVAYGPCIEGFNYCRPLLFLDGTFLKSRYKGTLLAATGKDANNGLYPLAFAIVGVENEDNWTWFMQEVSQILSHDRQITFVSDRNKGLLNAVSTVFPNSPHAFCVIHLRSNLRDRLGGMARESKSKMGELLMQVAQTPSREECDKCISYMLRIGQRTFQDFLDDTPLENWANSYFPGKRYGELYSNVAESFNKWIKSERNLPVKSMVDDIRKKIMSRMAARRNAALKLSANGKTICPNNVEWLKNAINKGRTWEIRESDTNTYEVLSEPSVMVNLVSRTCSCYYWQIRCFPCSHALATILHIKRNVLDYIEDYYLASNWYAAHEKTLYPTPSLGQPTVPLEDIEILPPVTKIPPGRPKKNRIPPRSAGFTSRPVTCSRCGVKGRHNRKTCRAVIE